MRGLGVVGELGVACHRLRQEPGSAGEMLLVEGDLGEDQAFGVVKGLVLTAQQGRKPQRPRLFRGRAGVPDGNAGKTEAAVVPLGQRPIPAATLRLAAVAVVQPVTTPAHPKFALVDGVEVIQRFFQRR